VSPRLFSTEVPAEYGDQWRKVFGDLHFAGVSYQYGGSYGYGCYNQGTHCPRVQPPVQGMTSGKISSARKAARQRVLDAATVWGVQMASPDDSFAYAGPCGKDWWPTYHRPGEGWWYSLFVGATMFARDGYGHCLWESGPPPVGWNVVDSENTGSNDERDPWDLQLRLLMKVDDSVWYWDVLVLGAGAARLLLQWPSYATINLIYDSLDCVVEVGDPSWVPGTVTWGSMPGSWSEVDRFVPDVLGGSRVVEAVPDKSYRLRWDVVNPSRPTPAAEGFVLINDLTAYAHA